MAQEKYVAYVGTYTHENSIGMTLTWKREN